VATEPDGDEESLMEEKPTKSLIEELPVVEALPPIDWETMASGYVNDMIKEI